KSQAERSFHADLVAHADAEPEPAAADLGERESRLGHRHRMARIDRDDPVAEAEARRRRAVRREDQERIAPGAVSDPRAVVAERLGAAREVDAGREIAPRIADS